jgi:hypothetical protein
MLAAARTCLTKLRALSARVLKIGISKRRPRRILRF